MTGALVQETSLSRIRDRSGRFAARLSYRVPSNVTRLTVMVPPGTEVTGVDGFARRGGRQFRWSGGSGRPRLELAASAGGGTLGGLGGATTADVGDWAIVEAPHVMTQWRHRGSQPAFRRRVAVDDRGVASSDGGIVYLGPHEEHVRRAAGQRIRLVEPAAASLAEPPGEILDALAFAARELEVGGRNDEVVGVAAPTRPVNWGAGGLQAGANGFWVRDSATLDTPNSSWPHEYVHTRQEFGTSAGTKWLIEATAVYYATLLAHRRGDVDDGTYHAALNTDRCADDVLGNPHQWSSAHAPYQKGSRVAAWLDARIRAESDATLADVLAAMNRASDQSVTGTPLTTALSGGDAITYDDFERLVADAMGVAPGGRVFRELSGGLDAVVNGREVPEEHPPPGLAERPPDVPDAPGMPGDLTELLEEAFGERFGEEVVESDGRIDEGTVFGGDGPEVGEMGDGELEEGTGPGGIGDDEPWIDDDGDDSGEGGPGTGGGPGSGGDSGGGIVEPGEIFGGDGPGTTGTVTVRVETAGGEVDVSGDVEEVDVESDGRGISVEAAGADVSIDGTDVTVEGGGTEISVSGSGISVESSGGTDVSVSTTGGIQVGGDVEVGTGSSGGDACSFCGADLSGHDGGNCPSCGWPVGW